MRAGGENTTMEINFRGKSVLFVLFNVVLPEGTFILQMLIEVKKVKPFYEIISFLIK